MLAILKEGSRQKGCVFAVLYRVCHFYEINDMIFKKKIKKKNKQ